LGVKHLAEQGRRQTVGHPAVQGSRLGVKHLAEQGMQQE
jgi:hypothetical protein